MQGLLCFALMRIFYHWGLKCICVMKFLSWTVKLYHSSFNEHINYRSGGGGTTLLKTFLPPPSSDPMSPPLMDLVLLPLVPTLWGGDLPICIAQPTQYFKTWIYKFIKQTLSQYRLDSIPLIKRSFRQFFLWLTGHKLCFSLSISRVSTVFVCL